MSNPQFKKFKAENDFSTTENDVLQPGKSDPEFYPRTSTTVWSFQPLQDQSLDDEYEIWVQRLAEPPKKIKLRGTRKKLDGIMAGMLLRRRARPFFVHHNAVLEEFVNRQLELFPGLSHWFSHGQQQNFEVAKHNSKCNCGEC